MLATSYAVGLGPAPGSSHGEEPPVIDSAMGFEKGVYSFENNFINAAS
jgi:hypothetical protein